MTPALGITLMLFGLDDQDTPAFWAALERCHAPQSTAFRYAVEKTSRSGSTVGTRLQQLVERFAPQVVCAIVEHLVEEHALPRQIASRIEEGILWCTTSDGHWR
jgi:hypothetical protein